MRPSMSRGEMTIFTERTFRKWTLFHNGRKGGSGGSELSANLITSWDNLKLPAVWFGAKSWFVVRDLLGPSHRQYEFSAPATAHRSLVLPRWKPISATSKGSSPHTAPFPHDPIAVFISNLRHR